ncbi:hypothetical protein BH11ACT8_BH11ACT8_25290 [soil metagenome]
MKQSVLRLALATVMLVAYQALPTTTASASAPGTGGGEVAAAKFADAAPAAKNTKKKKDGRRYKVQAGVTFNDPYTAPFPTRDKVLGAINHVGDGEIIRTMSWSFYDSAITNALIRAHQRGVIVELFMSRGLSTDESAGQNFRQLKAALQKGPRPKTGPKSFARTCSHSCRGRGGSMHDKWMSISRSGGTYNIVMFGSANLNIRAAVDQWNDWYTFTGNKKIYDTYQEVFRQATKDRPWPTITKVYGKVRLFFAPRHSDPVMNILNDVVCRGARNGNNGRTIIRIASAVIQGARGEGIARRLKTLQSQGCDIQMVYTLAPKAVRNILTNFPIRQLAFDHNDDGLYDDYLHMKAMAVRGRVGDDRAAHIVYTGSGNWSKLGMISDEQGMVAERQGLTNKYIRWISKIYGKAHTATSARVSERSMRKRGVNPYANVELELR